MAKEKKFTTNKNIDTFIEYEGVVVLQATPYMGNNKAFTKGIVHRLNQFDEVLQGLKDVRQEIITSGLYNENSSYVLSIDKLIKESENEG